MEQKKLVTSVRSANRGPLAVACLQGIGIALALSGGYVPAAFAQENPAVLPTLDEVVVTARRKEESLEDVPIAITAMSADDLRTQNVTQLYDLGTKVPSLRISEGGTSTNVPLITLRGQRPSEVTLAADAAVPLYFADVVITPVQGTNLSMYDLANVQVLKGPQGTLFGRNSTGGAILLTPQGPGDTFGGYAEAKVGDYNLYQVEGAVDVPVSDMLAVRLAGQSVDRDGYQSNVADNALRGDDKYWDQNSYGLRMTARFTPTEDLQNLLTVAYDENEMLGRVPVPQVWNLDTSLGSRLNQIFNGSLNGVYGTPTAHMVDDALARAQGRDVTDIETNLRGTDRIRNWFLANTTEYDLAENLTLKNIFGYRNLDFHTATDADGMAIPFIGSPNSNTGWTNSHPPMGKSEATQYSEELQLLGTSFDDKLDWLVGAFWMQASGSQSLPTQIIGPNPDWPAGPAPAPSVAIAWLLAQNGVVLQDSPRGNFENTGAAIFGEATYSFNEQWSLTLGARQTWDEREIEAQNLNQNASLKTPPACAMRDENNRPLPNDNCARVVDHGWDKPTGRASVNWTPTEDMLVYLSAGTGYRSGGFNLRGTNNFTLQPYDPETVTTYEFGHKTEWHLFDLAAMRTNLAVYFQQYDDIQKTQSGIDPQTGSFATYTVNAAEAEISGVEFDVLVAPIEDLTLSLGYSYVDTEYKKWEQVKPALNNRLFDYSNAPFVYVPENTLTGTIQYTLPLDASVGDVSLTGSVYWQDHMWTNADAETFPYYGWSPQTLDAINATLKADGYSVWNFRADWNSVMGSEFDLAAFVDNAFDEEYVTGGLSVPESFGVAFTFGAPRTYGASLRYRF